jgi:hypothetical protein
MKMLDLITLQVIEDIFDSTNKVQSLSKSLYINCLIKQFKDKDATQENSIGFHFEKKQIPNYEKWDVHFQDLQNAGLIQINPTQIVFENKWGQLIDREKLVQNHSSSIPVSGAELEIQLKNNSSMIDVICMKNKMTKSQVNSLIKIFILEQLATNTTHKDSGELAKHFIYWVTTNLDKIDMTGETVKSKGKILGLE